MKRLICVLLCVLLAGFSSVATAAEQLSLQEKMQRQVEYGSGVKGTLQYTVEGDSALAEQLRVLSDLDIELRTQITQEQYETKLYVPNGESELAVSFLWGNGETAHLQSDLLPQRVLLPVQGDVLQALLPRGEDQNPVWYGILWQLLRVDETVWAENWAPVLAPYENTIELWLSRFGDAPVLVPDAATGTSVMALTYTVPAEELKAELKVLLDQALGDQALAALMRTVMTDQQQALYWNPGLMYFYNLYIDGLYLEGDVVLEREMSALGEELSISAQFPIPENEYALQYLRIERTAAQTALSLFGEGTRLDLTIADASNRNGLHYSGRVELALEDREKTLSADYDFTRGMSTRTDDEGYGYETYPWSLSLVPDNASTLLTEEVLLSGTNEFRSKNSQYNATRLTFTGEAALPGAVVTWNGNLRTANPWDFAEMPAADEVDYSRLNVEERLELFSGILPALRNALSPLKPIELPQPELATPSDL